MILASVLIVSLAIRLVVTAFTTVIVSTSRIVFWLSFLFQFEPGVVFHTQLFVVLRT